MRKGARKSVLDYARAIEIPGKPVSDDPDTEFFQPVESVMAHHHRVMLTELERVANTHQGRLMILMPPGSAKTTYSSVVFPSYFLGQRPNTRIIQTSYGDTLARKIGRRVRAIARQDRYSGIWSASLSKDSSAAQEFALTNGSEYMGAGILSGITGNRAHGLIIDDPIKGRAEANSEAVRENVWSAYQDDLLTRLIPGGWIVMILTRWHMDDPAGRILPEDWNGQSGYIECRDGNTWYVLCIQARCEQPDDPLGRQIGEYLWPEWFPESHWKQFENAPLSWASLFQQIPTPGEGLMFKPDKITVIDALPKDLHIRWVRGWDLAATADPSAAFTAGAKMGILPDNRIILGDMARGQWGVDERDEVLVSTASRDGYTTHIDLPQDPGQAGKSQIAHLTRLLTGYIVKSSPETGDKATRAEPFASQVNAGNVVMLRGNWNDKCIDEMRSFPNSKWKDQVDAMSRAYNSLIENSNLSIWAKLGED